MNQERMRGKRAYWCFRGNFMLGRFFRQGKVRPWFFFPRGEINTGILFPGRFYPGIPGRFFRGGEVLCGGKLYATTPVSRCNVVITHEMISFQYICMDKISKDFTSIKDTNYVALISMKNLKIRNY